MLLTQWRTCSCVSVTLIYHTGTITVSSWDGPVLLLQVDCSTLSEDRFTFLSWQTHICVDDPGSNIIHLMRPTFIIQCPAKVSVNVVGWAAPQLNPVTAGRFGRLWSCKGYTCIGMTFMERSSEENISCILTLTFRIRSHKFGKEHPGRPDGSCGKMRFQQNSLGAVRKGLFGEQRRRIWWTSVQLQRMRGSSRLWGCVVVSGNVPQIEGRRIN